MWTKKLILRFIYWFSLRFKNRDKYLYNLGLYDCIYPPLFENLNDNVSSLKDMLLIYNNIFIYINSISYCNTFLIEGKTIPNDWCKYDYRNSKLSLFLKDNKGKFIDNKKYISELKEKLIIFNEEYNKSLLSDDITKNHNARVLGVFYDHLTDVAEILVRSSIY